MMTNSAYINDAVMQLQIILDVCKENDTYTFIKMGFFPSRNFCKETKIYQ